MMPFKNENMQNQKKERRRDNLIYGRHTVIESLRSGKVKKVYFYKGMERKFQSELKSICDAECVPMSPVDSEYLQSRLGKSNHQGVLAEIIPFDYTDFDQILQMVEERKSACILVLAHLEDPGNLGAILRSSAAFNITAVILPNKRSALVNATVAKTSAGTLGMVPITVVANLRNAVNMLKERNMWVIGSDSSGSQDISEFEFPNRSVIIIGAESKGIPQLLLSECDYTVRIGINDAVDSLNVSAASAIFLYKASEVLRSDSDGGGLK
jgi:23S rRNA (guanosine2251-2'-O)-methyltransferase